jgi:hypothetical protein
MEESEFELNIPLNEEEGNILDKNKHHFRGLLMLFHQLGCKKVLEIPFVQNGEEYKVRIEKIKDN